MGYREKAATRHKCSNKKRVQCRYSTFGPGSRTHVTNLLNEGATAIIDLIERVERAERENQRLRELVNADHEGRCVMLPCKVGDTVYEPNKRGFVSTYKIISIHVSECSTLIGWESIDGIYSNINGFEVSALGETVFLTREEAEKTLEDMEI